MNQKLQLLNFATNGQPYLSVINGKELSENRTQIQNEHHRNHLHQKAFPMIHLKRLGDSIVKHVNGWETSRKLKNCIVKVISFSGATVQCMADYVKSLLRDKTSHLILQYQDQWFKLQQSSRIYSDFKIVEQGITIKDDHHDVSMSNRVIRKDNLKNAEEVNSYLKELCMKNSIFVIYHSKSVTSS